MSLKELQGDVVRLDKATEYKKYIKENIRETGLYDKIKKAEALKGTSKGDPVNPEKHISIQLYKSLDKTLYKEAHLDLLKRLKEIKTTRSTMAERNS